MSVLFFVTLTGCNCIGGSVAYFKHDIMLEQPFADIDNDDVQSRATNAIVRSRMEEARWQHQRQEHIIQSLRWSSNPNTC
jgi:hypothetical protein